MSRRKGGWSQDGSKWDNKPTHTPVAHTCRMTYQPARGAVSRQNRRRRTPVYALSSLYAGSKEEARADKEKDRDTQQSRGRKKCMSGRRVEERVKSNEAATGKRGSQQRSKGHAQGRGHGGHTTSTTPHPDTGGPREERHHAPRHARHRHHTHRTHPTNPCNPPSSGRAVGRGTAPDPRRPSQWWKAPPPGTPFRHPHSEQRRPARAHAVGPVLGPHARTDRARDTRVAEPWLPAPEDGRPGEGQRLTPGAPHNGGRHPPGDALPPPPQRATPARKGARCGAGAGSTRPHRPHPGHTGRGTLAARSRGRAAGGGTAPDTRRPSERWKAPPPGTPFRHPHSEQRRPAKGARCGAGAGSTRPHRPHPGHTGRGTLAARSRGRAAGGGTASDTRRPSQRWKAPPPGTPLRHPHSEQRRPARVHAGGPVLGSHARIDRTRDTRVAEPWLPAPEDGRPGEGQRLTPGAPHNGGRHPPRGRPSATPTASNAGPQGRTLWGRCWVHTPASTAPGTHGSRNPGCPLQRTGGRGRDSA